MTFLGSKEPRTYADLVDAQADIRSQVERELATAHDEVLQIRIGESDVAAVTRIDVAVDERTASHARTMALVERWGVDTLAEARRRARAYTDRLAAAFMQGSGTYTNTTLMNSKAAQTSLRMAVGLEDLLPGVEP